MLAHVVFYHAMCAINDTWI